MCSPELANVKLIKDGKFGVVSCGFLFLMWLKSS
jgi:hypothetical protein